MRRGFIFIIVLALTITSAASDYITVPCDGYVMDSLDGVSAIYDLTPGQHQCGELVKRYYLENYGVELDFFLQGPVCLTVGYDMWERAGEPLPGDVAYLSPAYRSNGCGHWAIVREVTDSGVVLLEQNWAWDGQGAYRREIGLDEGYSFFYLSDASGGSIPSLWASSGVELAKDLGLYSGGELREYTTRQEFITLITRMRQLLGGTELGAVIEPDPRPITRQEAAVLISGLLSVLGMDTEGQAQCEDLEDIAPWARAAAGEMMTLCYMPADNNGRFESKAGIELQQSLLIMSYVYRDYISKSN